MGINIRFTWSDVKDIIRSWFEWQDAKKWAKKHYPAWAQLATQYKRPEIKETYRKKILSAYRKGY